MSGDSEPVSGTELADRIRNVRISPVHLREGYDMGQVDHLLDLLEQEARRGGDLGAVVRGVTLGRVRLREGYDIDEVDRFLADVVQIRVTPPDSPAAAAVTAPGSTAWAIRSLVERVRFTPVRLREGYDMADVDNFLDRVVEAAERGEPIGPLVERARFTPVRMREGYDMGEVDAFLAQLADPDPASQHSDLVQEQPSLLERLRRKL